MIAWPQTYDPFHNRVVSTLVAAIPIVTLLGVIAIGRVRAHRAALLGLFAALMVAILALGMPVGLAIRASLLGVAYGLLPIGWIILNVIFLYRLTEERGLFVVLQRSLGRVTTDRRLQLVLIAFSFGAFFEGAAGFGTPVAVTGAILIGLGFPPLEASGLSLLANTAPVAFGALGTPLIGLHTVTDIDLRTLSAMVGRQLPFFSVLIPFWLIIAYAGWKKALAVWPALVVAGVAFAIPQWLISNYHGPWLVDVVSAVISLGALSLLLRVWHPSDTTREVIEPEGNRSAVLRAWTPWVILSVVVFLWGLPQVKALLDHISAPKFPIPGLDGLIERVPPVVPKAKPETAVFLLNWLSASGTGILVAALIAGVVMGYRPVEMAKVYWRSLVTVRLSLITIAAMLGIGYLTRYSGMDAILGLAFASTGMWYPFFGTFLGWLGVALTGSDTASNVLFGSLQTITSHQLGLSPTLMAAANSSGGVMGKMIDMQSIVVASTTTKWYGHEWAILRFVFLHSLALAGLVGLLVTLEAYVAPFTALVLH
ncbi:MAG TPA: L-lactate permease [Gemmatimonadaceae bacterium]|nr:L-lactate permease [Gemmatimonadaceae bacterium]